MQTMVEQAEIHRKAVSDEVEERIEAAWLLRYNFADLPGKDKAWDDLHRLIQDKVNGVRLHAADALGHAFPHVPDKKQAWDDLHRLIQDKVNSVRLHAADALGHAFPHVPDKKQAWEDLIRLNQDGDKDVQRRANNRLGAAFSGILDIESAWKDLFELMQDKDVKVRRGAVHILGIAFPHVPDKTQVWHDLIRLTGDKDVKVRRGAVRILGTAFPHVTDKTQVWHDLIRLTGEKDVKVRQGAAYTLGHAFPHVTDKKQVWEDLHRLTQDEDRVVQISVNHCLGRLSIVKATEAESEESFRNELQEALRFFESSRGGILFDNPSSFCLPFYRSFYAITYEKEKAEDEVKKYLAEAKSASKNSKSKKTLIEAVENLAKALSEAQSLREANLDVIQHKLNTYMQYCNRAADLIGSAEEGAPGAAQVLRRGLPIIDDRIKEIIREIQENAEAVCRETQETPLEEFGLATAKSAQELPTQDLLALTMALGSMASIARGWCEYLPTDKKVDACEQLKNLTDIEILEQGVALARVFEYVQENIHIPKIQTVHISETEQEIVRIAVAQIYFELTESLPFTIKKRDEVKTKIFSALEIAKQDGVNIVCLPELCLCEEWINEIKRKYIDMIVIGGSFYEDNKNICPIMWESDIDIPHQPKITPSASERGVMGPRMVPGERVYKYETRFGKFVILICKDFDDLAHYFRKSDIDMIFCPSFNPDNERFQEEANSHVKKTPSYVLIANTGKYGGTSIFGRMHKDYFETLVDGKCKDAGDSTYKLCEIKEGQEEVILHDFRINRISCHPE